MVTIEDINAAGKIPESFYDIKPGVAIFYASEDGVSSSTRQLVLDLFDKCCTQHKDFRIEIKVETTSNQFLKNTVVARRLNLGSLLRYNLLMVKLNCTESVDAFVKEFFNLTSRDDSPFKYIIKESVLQKYLNNYSSGNQSRSNFQNHTMGMIMLQPSVKQTADDEEIIERTQEEIDYENELIQTILYHADKDKDDDLLKAIQKRIKGRYVITEDPNDVRLVFTKELKLILIAGDYKAELNFSNRELAFYLLVLAFPEGIKVAKLEDYEGKLSMLYEMLMKRGTNEGIDSAVTNLITKPGERKIVVSRIKNTICKKLLNKTAHRIFEIQYNKNSGVYFIELPRKFFEYRADNSVFSIIQDSSFFSQQ